MSFRSVLACFLLAGVLFVGCDEGEPALPPPIDRDLSAIQERDTLVALAAYNSTGYFLYRGEPMGYEYELLKAFADDHDLALRIEVVRNRDSLFYRLNAGDGDVVAARIVPTVSDSADVTFTSALYRTQPTVVQRANPLDSSDVPQKVDTLLEQGPPGQTPDSVFALPPGKRLGPQQVKARLVKQPQDLAGEEVYVQRTSAYYDNLLELSDTLTGDIQVVEVPGDVSAESLMRGVAEADIDLTVAQANVAKLTESYFTNLLVYPTVGQTHQVAWATRRNATDLTQAFDEWIESGDNQQLFDQLYQKYFVDRRGYEERLEDEYLTSETGKLSPYDDLLRENAGSIDWDWRLLASQTYQESRFKPRAQSWAGAKGLLQLMPPTARQYDVTNPFDPEDNVSGAVRFLEWLQDYWEDKIPSEKERLKFVLASYNAGQGHVQDARNLTEKYGGDPTVWDDVAYWLLQLSKHQFYEDPVVKYGFCRGLEPVTYVSRILDRFEHYRQFVVEEPGVADASPASEPDREPEISFAK